MNEDATSVASLCLTLSNSLKRLVVVAPYTTSAYVPTFGAVVTQCVLLQSLTLKCMSSNFFPILFFPSLLLMLCHFLVLMRYNAGHQDNKAKDEDVASLFQALRRNKSITYLDVADGEYGWMSYYNCVLLNSSLCDCCSSITDQSCNDIFSLILVINLFHSFVYCLTFHW